MDDPGVDAAAAAATIGVLPFSAAITDAVIIVLFFVGNGGATGRRAAFPGTGTTCFISLFGMAA